MSMADEISKQSVQAAIAKAMELRAIHAALTQQQSNNYINSPFAKNFDAQDYPVFTPSYEQDGSLPVSEHITGNYSDDYSFTNGLNLLEESFCSDYRTKFQGHLHDRNSFSNRIDSVRRSSPGHNNHSRSRRDSLGSVNSVSSCSNFNTAAAVISNESSGNKKSNIVVPLTDSRITPLTPRARNYKGLGFSWLLPRLKKKKKNENENSPAQSQFEEINTNFGMLSVETLKKELLQANKSRDAALTEVAEMKSSIRELSEKLKRLETYCEELRKALRPAMQFKVNNSHQHVVENNLLRRGTSIDRINADNYNDYSIPVSEEVMVEGFLQIVSEARLSVKQFCKTMLGQIGENNHMLLENLNLSLHLSVNSKHSSKLVLYHLEAVLNQSLYQDFENRVFQRNGAPKILNPNQDRLSRFKSFATLQNLGWNEVVRKGTKRYSKEFSRFCDQKMSGIITTLRWTRPWPEQLLQAFFMAAKCVWLLHLLAFSFDPPLRILRVDEDAMFEGSYMEDILGEKERSQGLRTVQIMVVPGFYVLIDKVLKCKVLCRSNNAVS